MYAPKDANDLPQVILDIQAAPLQPSSIAAQEKEIASKTVSVHGQDYVVRMATTTQFPKVKKTYYPFINDVVASTLDELDTSKPFYGEGKVPRSLIDQLNGTWCNAKGKKILTVQGPRLNGEELEAVYNVEETDGDLSMTMISIKEDQVHQWKVERKTERDQFGQSAQVLYINGDRTTQTNYNR